MDNPVPRTEAAGPCARAPTIAVSVASSAESAMFIASPVVPDVR